MNRSIFYVYAENVYSLTSENGTIVSVHPEESLFSDQKEADTRIILHCHNITRSLPQTFTIIIRSPDTDVLMLLLKYCKEIKTQILSDTGMGNKRCLLNVNDIYKNKGEDICFVLPALHCFTGCDTTSAFVSRVKMFPLKLVERKPEYITFLQRIGQDRQCSESLISDMEAFTCAIYGNAATKNLNKLRYDTFLKKYQDRLYVLNLSNGMDMSLLQPCQSALEMHIQYYTLCR